MYGKKVANTNHGPTSVVPAWGSLTQFHTHEDPTMGPPRRSHGVRSHPHGFLGPAESNQAGPPDANGKSNLPVPRFLLETPEAPFSRDCLVEPLALHPGFRDLSVCAASDDLHLDHAPVACKCCSHLVEE